MNKQKPDTVPPEAEWNEGDKEWAVGKKNEKGVDIGIWKWWREDGTLVCETHYDGESGKNIEFSRFHQDGTFSWKGTQINGQNHGVHTCQKSENPSTESVNLQSQQFDPKIYSWKHFFDHGRPTRMTAFFNKDGQEVSYKGILKPKNLPEEASAVADGTWRLEPTSDGILEKFKGVLFDWDDQGRVTKKCTFDVKTSSRKNVVFYDSGGNIYCEEDYENKKGFVVKPETDAFFVPAMDVSEFFKGETYKITYSFHSTNELEEGVRLKSNQEYFDRNGNQLTSAGERLVKPTQDAKLITESTYQGSELYFYESLFEDMKNKDWSAGILL